MGERNEKINGKEVKVTSAGYLYINGVKVWKIKITPLHVPGVVKECTCGGWRGLAIDENDAEYTVTTK